MRLNGVISIAVSQGKPEPVRVIEGYADQGLMKPTTTPHPVTGTNGDMVRSSAGKPTDQLRRRIEFQLTRPGRVARGISAAMIRTRGVMGNGSERLKPGT